MQKLDNERGYKVGLVDAHNVASVRQDFDITSSDVTPGTSFGRHNFSDQPILAAEEH
jgi:hypothetical protein